jgi:hypothetical protein
MEILRLFNAVDECIFTLVDVKHFFNYLINQYLQNYSLEFPSPISSQFIGKTIEKHRLPKRTDTSASPLVSSSMSYRTVIQFLRNFSENLKADDFSLHFRQKLKYYLFEQRWNTCLSRIIINII